MKTYSEILTQIYGKPELPILSELENKCVCELTFYPEDIDVKTNLPINGFDKCLAIAVYDWHTGSIKDGDFVSQALSKSVFEKLFNSNLEMLF
jgi:hypothetical protein